MNVPLLRSRADHVLPFEHWRHSAEKSVTPTPSAVSLLCLVGIHWKDLDSADSADPADPAESADLVDTADRHGLHKDYTHTEALVVH